MARSIDALLRKVVGSRNPVAALKEVRQRSTEILDYLDTDEGNKIAADIFSSASVERLAAFYKALSDGECSKSKEVRRPLRGRVKPAKKGPMDEKMVIGRAFRKLLYIGDTSLERKNLNVLLGYLKGAPKVEHSVRESLRTEPDVVGAEGSADELLDYGVTPVVIYDIADSVSAILERGYRRRLFPENALVTLSASEGVSCEENQYLISASTILAELCGDTRCSIETCRAILLWEIGMVEFRPYIFPGFEGKHTKDGVVLWPSSKHFGSLIDRWSAVASRLS